MLEAPGFAAPAGPCPLLTPPSFYCAHLLNLAWLGYPDAGFASVDPSTYALTRFRCRSAFFGDPARQSGCVFAR